MYKSLLFKKLITTLMKKLFIFMLVATFSLTLTACQSKTDNTTSNSPDNLKNKVERTALSDFQQQAADLISEKALTIDEISEFVPENAIVTEENGKERTGFGGKVFNVNIDGETVMVISYFTFESSDTMKQNFQALYDSSPEKEDLEFTENAFFSAPLRKVIYINDYFKFDARYVGSNLDVYSEETLKKIAEAAYNKSTE